MARKQKFATTIRMGAAYNDITTRSLDGKKTATLPLPRPEKRDRKDGRKLALADLTSVAEMVCELHGIREPLKRNAKGHFEKRQPKPKAVKPYRPLGGHRIVTNPRGTHCGLQVGMVVPA
ncbi:hypothetical protein [Methylobacterium ajmalii]|jgi:hypothetical protein|uniref:hypothetical protein n=1 Tax=Methylobacterium ajmalii TaxID=2738439 RepID=UPI00190BBE8E|nr:hypothetical protein [Methylobacterium ajmalii]MBK3400403.1 hypothetical protein [Methylobacterium ajmalii]MBK3407555.1 hypothetical protein [Methylobacterium ajmalii]MBK3422096.1 hypothetical protein [Methylobacterium ajmalii]MBZ6415633.1 hypothetical protein [Methylobacterium sp.]